MNEHIIDPNEYRIPTIDEFVDGFEYEFHGMTYNIGHYMMNIDGTGEFIPTPEEHQVKVWNQEKYSIVPNFDSRTFESIVDCLKRGQIRVKVRKLIV